MQPFLPTLDDLPTQWKTWKEQFGSYLIANGLDRAPTEKQLAIFLQRLGTDRQRILPAHTGNKLKPARIPYKKMLSIYHLKNYSRREKKSKIHCQKEPQSASRALVIIEMITRFHSHGKTGKVMAYHNSFKGLEKSWNFVVYHRINCDSYLPW